MFCRHKSPATLKHWSDLPMIYLDLLYTDQEVKRVFTSGHIASLRSAKTFSSYLVQAKSYPLKRHVSSFNCGRNR